MEECDEVGSLWKAQRVGFFSLIWGVDRHRSQRPHGQLLRAWPGRELGPELKLVQGLLGVESVCDRREQVGREEGERGGWMAVAAQGGMQIDQSRAAGKMLSGPHPQPDSRWLAGWLQKGMCRAAERGRAWPGRGQWEKGDIGNNSTIKTVN